jgi:cell division protein FtsB
MEAKLKQYYKLAIDFILRLQDVRFLGLVLFVVVVLLISWSGIKAIETNYHLQRQISVLQQQNDVQELKNANQRLKNQYYKTDQYKELSARQHFGLANPGEKMPIVPKDVALRYAVAQTDDAKAATATPTTKQSRFSQNYQAWLNFFLHRTNVD